MKENHAGSSYPNRRKKYETMDRRSSEGDLLDNRSTVPRRTINNSADTSPNGKQRRCKQAYLPLHGNTLLRIVTANDNLSVETYPESRETNETLPVNTSRYTLYGTLPRTSAHNPYSPRTISRTSFDMSSPTAESPEALPSSYSDTDSWNLPSNIRRRSDGTVIGLFGTITNKGSRDGSVESLVGTSPKQEETSIFDNAKDDADSGFGQASSEIENEEITRL